MKTSVIIPTVGRTQIVIKRIVNLLDTTDWYDLEILVVTEDQETIKSLLGMYHQKYINLVHAEGNAVEKWNIGAGMATGDYLVLGADDIIWKPDWLTTALTELGDMGFIGLYEGRFDPSIIAQHFLATREWYKKYNGGTLAIPCYRSWFLDTETSERAKRSGTFKQTSKVVIEHQKDMDMGDETYQRGARWHLEDKRIFDLRKILEFPDDFHGVIK